jgi:hypothetical protein
LVGSAQTVIFIHAPEAFIFMRNLFYASVVGFVLFEIANVYFILPMPGSQQINSIDLAYGLYSWRWLIRSLFLLGILAGFRWAWFASRIFTVWPCW